MTDAFYADAVQTASELIREFGQKGQIQVTNPGGGPSYDPGEPTYTDYAADICVLGFAKRDIDGTRIKATDKRILVAARGLEIEPATDHRLVDAAGTSYEVVSVDPLSPAGAPVFYWIQARA